MGAKGVEDKSLPAIFDKVKQMYFGDRVVDPTKRDKIFNWFFDQFKIYQKKKSSLRYKLLWLTFHDILVKEKLSSGHRILIKSHAVKDFSEAVMDYPYSDSWAPVILSSISTFLQTSTVNATLIADVDTMLKLLIGTLRIISQIHGCNSGDLQSLQESLGLANIILDILENLPSSNEEDKALILSDSLQDIALFMHISVDDSKLENLCEKLAKKMNLIVFNLKSKQFETLLTPAVEKPKEIEEPNANILKFFLSLQNLLVKEEITFQSISVNVACATLMKKLLHNFFMQNKTSFHSLKVLSLFLAASGMDVPIGLDATSCCKSLFKENYKNTDISILGITQLLEACFCAPQYFISVPPPDGYLKPSIWLRGVSLSLLSVKNSKSKSAWLKCFQCLLTISPTVLDSDILPLIKMAFLNISVHSTESKKQYCELFNTILQAHSQLHQVPKFFVKLILALTECIKDNSGGKFLANGQILPQVEESIARCIRGVPYGQMIELWKIFIETFSTLEIMSEAFMVNKGFIFFVAQLFSTFLLNAQLFQANIPSKIHSQFSNLIDLTSAEIKKNITALKETDVNAAPLQRSVLLLTYAIGEVKLAYNAIYGKPVGNPESVLTLDCSMLHSYLDKEHAAILDAFLNGDDKTLLVLVFQLLLQKISALDLEQSFSEEGKSTMQKSVTLVLEQLKISSSAVASWDNDLCAITNKNYGTVLWKMFSKVFPLMLSNLSYRDYCTLCEILQSTILQNDSFDSGVECFILSTLKNEFFQQSKHFQTAFVSVLWKRENLLLCKKRSFDDTESVQSAVERIFSLLNAYHSKALKYAQRTPKSSENLGSTWDEIKEISDLLNGILSSEALPKDKLIVDKIRDVMKLFNSLPLHCLLPGNQMKCTIGLSFLFFLIPQSCKSTEAVHLAKEISSVMVSIIKGTRSIWLFDFVDSGLYLKFVVKTLEAVIDAEMYDDCEWAIQLIDHLMSLIVKNVESLKSVQQYMSGAADKNKTSRIFLITFHSLLKELLQILSHSHKQEKYKDTFLIISSAACTSFVKYMKSNFNKNIESKNHPFVIKCYMLVIDIVVCPSFDVNENVRQECLEFLSAISQTAIETVATPEDSDLIDVYLLFLSKTCKHSTKVSSFVPEDFVSVSWNAVLTHLEKKSNQNDGVEGSSEDAGEKSCVLNSTSCFICFSNCSKEPSSVVKNVEQSKDVFDSSLVPFSLTESEEQSLQELGAITTSEKLSEVFEQLLDKMGCSRSSAFSISSFQTYLSVFKCLIDSIKDKCQDPMLNRSLQTCLLYLTYTISRTCSSQLCQTTVSVPILEFFNFVLRGNRGLPKQMLLQSLHCVVSFPADVHNHNYELYAKSFTAAWSVVYDLFMYHTPLVLESPAPFSGFVSKLLKSIVKAGAAEPLLKCDANTFQDIQLCSQNMNRLLTVISRHKNEFAKLVPYVVADYVDTVQHITLESSIKKCIISGIHRLLDICSEDSFKMLAVNINYTGREIYTNLVKSYKQHKYTGGT